MSSSSNPQQQQQPASAAAAAAATPSAGAAPAPPSGGAGPGGASLSGAVANGKAGGGPPVGAAAAAAAATAGNKVELTDQAVLEYLKSKGLGSAALELQQILEKGLVGAGNEGAGADGKKQQQQPTAQQKGGGEKSARERLEEEDVLNRNQRTLLSKSTGGGYGYDRDAAWPIAQWGVPDAGKMMHELQSPSAAGAATVEDRQHSKHLGVAEARAYLDAFTSIQLWVLGLPDQDGRQVIDNPIRRARDFLRENPETATLSAVVQELAHKETTGSSQHVGDTFFHLPPSSKPELLAVTFSLLVHTYCELLEVGMESTAHLLRDAFRPVYDGIYGQEFRDLYQCTSVDDMVRLNSHNSQHMEALSSLKSILVQVASYQLRREELHAQIVAVSNSVGQDPAQQAVAQQQREAKIQEYDRNVSILRQKYSEISQRASLAFDKMHDLPFLRRARAVRWQLTLSQTSYGLLAGYLSDESLLPMSTLLQTKCELHIEQREPLPFTPTVVLEEGIAATDDVKDADGSRQSEVLAGRPTPALDLNKLEINWAAPATRWDLKRGEHLPFPKYHLDDEYETEADAERDKKLVEFNRAVLINGFRRLEALERKRDFESMSSSAKKKRFFSSPSSSLQEAGGDTDTPSATEMAAAAPVANPLEPTILLTTLCSSSAACGAGMSPVARSKSSARGSSSGTGAATTIKLNDVSSIWQEPGIGLCCAKICPPDGRRIAVGCDDSAIRIWDVMDAAAKSSGSGAGEPSSLKQQQQNRCDEPCAVLLGHKNGFPVFDVDWNRDGRTLLSCGGDGSVRLWDTMAVGPFGEVVPLQKKKPPSKGSAKAASAAKSSGTASLSTGVAGAGIHKDIAKHDSSSLSSGMDVPGWRAEDVSYASGAALAVYRGHAPGSPVWSAKFAPCGYYFASAGGDATARLWTTDRPLPVRLFCGHTSSNVNSLEFHPNCNYLATGGDDRTCRLWDIQTGRTVRLLTGCASAVSTCRISNDGRYLAGADYTGTVHLWDLGMGRKVTEFRTASIPAQTASKGATSKGPQSSNNRLGNSSVHSLSFSTCGSALATGGDDCCVKIWNVNSCTSSNNDKTALSSLSVANTPAKIFQTRQTMIMDLYFTKRNLLLSAGKFVTPVPLVTPDLAQ